MSIVAHNMENAAALANVTQMRGRSLCTKCALPKSAAQESLPARSPMTAFFAKWHLAVSSKNACKPRGESESEPGETQLLAEGLTDGPNRRG